MGTGAEASLLRYPRLLQTNYISGFDQGTDLRYPEISGLQTGDARITIVAAQPPRLGEFSGGAIQSPLRA
jgi:hypothetical protein